MKKISLWMLVLCTVFALSSCGNQKESTLYVCVEASFEKYARDLLDTWHHLYSDKSAELIIIPDEPDEASIVINQIKTEIMAGKGPDVFIMSNIQNESPILFNNLEKSLYSEVFLPLDTYLADSKYMNYENLNKTILQAGKNKDGQLILPLTFTYWGFVYDSAASVGEWPNSLQTMLNNNIPEISGALANSMIYNFHSIFNGIANYEENRLLYTEDELLNIVQTIDKYIKEAMKLSNDELLYNAIVIGEFPAFVKEQFDSSIPHNFYGLPNLSDGITAYVTKYAAINRNTSHPELAFSLLDILFSDEILSGQGFNIDDEKHGELIGYYVTNFGQPVSDIGYKIIYSNFCDQNVEALKSLENSINVVRIFSDIDLDIRNMFMQYISIEDEYEKAQLVRDTYKKLEMKLQE